MLFVRVGIRIFLKSLLHLAEGAQHFPYKHVPGFCAPAQTRSCSFLLLGDVQVQPSPAEQC